MNFDINVWLKFRKQAQRITSEIAKQRDEHGYIIMPKKQFDKNIEEITATLKMCSVYLDRCGMHMPAFEKEPVNG